MEEEFECEVCKERVRKTNHRQKFCSFECREKHKREEAMRKWVERKPRKPDHDKGGKMERSANYNQTGGWMRKFSNVRG